MSTCWCNQVTWSNQCHRESKSQGHGAGCYNSNKTLTTQTCNQKSEISRYDMVSSDVIVATCHDSVSSHLMSFCMQLWHNGQFFFHTDTYTLRTKTNCRPEDLEALQKSAGLASMLCMLFCCLSDIEVWSLALATLEQNRGLLPNFVLNITTSTDLDSIVFCAALLHQSAVLDQLNRTKDVINLTKKNELTQTDKFW